MNLPPKKPRLGRGLDGMLPPAPAPRPPEPQAPARTAHRAQVGDLHPNKDQPRRHFDSAALDELAASIRELGVLEPIVVRKRAVGGYEIVSGERRWRAAQRAGVLEVPIHVLDLSDSVAFLASMVENLQREDLRPLEVARGYQRLVDEFSLTQDEVADKVGKSRSSVTNSLRLLKLPDTVLTLLDQGTLSEGHGRALLQAGGGKRTEALARDAAAKGWSVRETERRARAASASRSGGAGGGADEAPTPPPGKSKNLVDLERRLTTALGMVSTFETKSDARGRVCIEYASLDELDRLLDKLFR